MESPTGPQSDCENCVLCAASKKAHSWKNSGRVFAGVVRQKVKTGSTYVLQGISERSRWFEETHPKTTEFMGNTGRRILSVGVVVLENSKKAYYGGVSGVKNVYTRARAATLPSAEGVKTFFMENTIRCYFCGGVMLIAGTYLYTLPVAVTGSSSLFLCSMWFIFVGGFLIWIPIFYWYCSSRRINELGDSSSQTQLMDKPPLYESLLPSPSLTTSVSVGDEAPPSYEEIYTGSQDFLLHSNSGFVGVPLCAIHQPAESLQTHDNRNVSDTVTASSTHHTVDELNSVQRVISAVKCPKIKLSDFSIPKKSRSMSDLNYVRSESYVSDMV